MDPSLAAPPFPPELAPFRATVQVKNWGILMTLLHSTAVIVLACCARLGARMALPPRANAYRSNQPMSPPLQSYVSAKVKQFAVAFARRINLNLPQEALDGLVTETQASLATQEINTARALRLVLRHDCQ